MLSGIRFSKIEGAPLVGPSGNRVGRVADCVVRLVADGSLPRVTALLLRLEGQDLFISMNDVTDLSPSGVTLSSAKVDTRPFERRPGEVLLDRDVKDRAVIDVEGARLVRVHDLVLEKVSRTWRVAAIVPTLPRDLKSALQRLVGREAEDAGQIPWTRIEPLVGHVPTAKWRLPFLRLAQLRPADIADIVEEASHEEGQQILEAVSQDDELEADVFEELDDHHRVEFLGERSDEEVADVLASMEPDMAADALMQLDQDRRLPILNRLPSEEQKSIRSLLGYHPETAGGLMSTEFVSLAAQLKVKEAIDRLRKLEEVPVLLADVFVVDPDGRLVGSLTLISLLRAPAEKALGQVVQPDPPAVLPGTDVPSVALQMSDYNLTALPVVDEGGTLLGIVTSDDLIEAIIPEEWRWRGRPERVHMVSGKASATRSR